MVAKSSNRKKIVIILILIIFFVYVFNIFKTLHTHITDLIESKPNEKLFVYNDSNLFNKESQNKIQVYKIATLKGRNPFSFISFDHDYNIITYRIDILRKEASLRDILYIYRGNSSMSSGNVYTSLGLNDNIFFNFYGRSELIKPAQNILLNLSGDSLQIIGKSDSSVCLYLQCKNLSLRYIKDDPTDILITAIRCV